MLMKGQKEFGDLQKEMLERAERQKELAQRKAEQQRQQEERKQKLAEYQQELAELEGAYRQGGFQLFVVCGPEGSGKTMLVQEFCGKSSRPLREAQR